MTNLPRCDFHIHTKYLRCANGTMEIPAIVKECERLGMTSLGITDHLNSLDKLDQHMLIKKDLGELDTDLAVYFGVELNFMAVDGDFAFRADIREQYGFQYAIGGIHGTYSDTYDLQKIIDIQHRHHLKTCRDPLVDVLVHPYWFAKGEFTKKGFPWLDTMRPVPERYARELGQVAKETGTAIEINGGANLANPQYSDRYVKEYVEYLSIIAEEGACFMLSSDAHDINRLKDALTARDVAEQLHLPAERIWMPAGKPMAGRGAACR